MINTINSKERSRRRDLAGRARSLIVQTLPVEDADESSLMLGYGGFFLQIAFSELHPLMALYLARALTRPVTTKDVRIVNDLNLKSVLGGHAINTEAGCYSYRAVHWLDAELTKSRFVEILERSAEEAGRAYACLARESEETA